MAADRPLEGYSILLLEDELFIAAALREHLLMAGAAHVETPTTVSAAESCLSETKIDAAILDIVLPDGDTRRLAEKLAGQGVRVIFHSGHLRPEWLDGTLGDAIFLQKPSDADAIVAAVAGQSEGG